MNWNIGYIGTKEGLILRNFNNCTIFPPPSSLLPSLPSRPFPPLRT